ncbi:hypothetical protein [Haliangium sp.]|uniref:hypothetical protein n=1 Tax=Haliangium sp. TaxID=2663208 RepID=UPI003D0C336A
MEALAEVLRRADQAIPRGYEAALALLEAAARMPGADAIAPGIAARRLALALYHERPLEELEAVLVALLEVDHDLASRLRATGAAYVAYSELRRYFEREAAALAATEPSEKRVRLEAAVAEVRAAALRKFDDG